MIKKKYTTISNVKELNLLINHKNILSNQKIKLFGEFYFNPPENIETYPEIYFAKKINETNLIRYHINIPEELKNQNIQQPIENPGIIKDEFSCEFVHLNLESLIYEPRLTIHKKNNSPLYILNPTFKIIDDKLTLISQTGVKLKRNSKYVPYYKIKENSIYADDFIREILELDSNNNERLKYLFD